MMKKNLGAVLASLLVAAPFASAFAALPVGGQAPDFSLTASQGGKEFPFSLSQSLKSGPVVLYFYPAAFTRGCTIEAHDFADASDDFKALHATVIGVSMDEIGKLDKFSVSECRSKFAVGADPSGTVAQAYDAKMPLLHFANRTSYVIAPDGKILMAYTAASPNEHVTRTMAAVKAYEASTTR